MKYLEMYEMWAKDSENGFFGEKKVTITNKNCKNLRSFASQVF